MSWFGRVFGSSYSGKWWGSVSEQEPSPEPLLQGYGPARLIRVKIPQSIQRDDEEIFTLLQALLQARIIH